MIRDMIEWIPAVVCFGVKHMELFRCWESTKSITLSPVNSHKLYRRSCNCHFADEEMRLEDEVIWLGPQLEKDGATMPAQAVWFLATQALLPVSDPEDPSL